MLAVTGGKGGTGKTTTALGLARAFGADGTETVVVDADWDLPDLGAIAGVERRIAYLDGDAARSPLAAAVPDAEGANVRVLPAPTAPRERDVRKSLRRISAATPEATQAIVDCSAGAAADAVAPLRVAERAILVTEACAPALRDAAKIAAVARRLGTPVVGAVVTRSTVVPPGVADLLGCPVLARVPSASSPTARNENTNGSDPVLGDERVAGAYERAADALTPADPDDPVPTRA
ncbi:MinD/ParA family ATP-binding protein [Halobaculum magnesiiphilum]|uniref:P-loop NTPase n=1 Tax=Halobaculum magnesiiphilum TaxID=1017351 RepID=A0A8T8WEW5_9EURY|nr:P-loop NTPase [Halobaculum magnesiiphilum]QZP38385.1 P-loop NTPase [Halobaculum magnesiiphilum]